MSFELSDVTFDFVPEEDVDAAQEIEQREYPADEAGSAEAFKYRQAHAPELFLGAYLPIDGSRKLIGYICATLSVDDQLTRQSMTRHISNGNAVCIHSVCVSGPYRRKGVALAMLKEYLDRLDSDQEAKKTGYDRVLLITHSDIVPLYQKAGFDLVGLSHIIHGPRKWFQMRRAVPFGKDLESPVIPLDKVMSVLQKPRRVGPPRRILHAFTSGIMDVTRRQEQMLVNKFDLMCIKCGSCILKEGLAQWFEKDTFKLEPANVTIEHMAPLPSPPAQVQWWLIKSSPMAFENVGFTHPIDGRAIRMLTCGECELGPIGYCNLDTMSEAWVLCSRVAYRQDS